MGHQPTDETATTGGARELVVLGTASQAPTRHRNHNGYLLRWDEEAYLFDPGEGTQRQLILAGVPATRITHICITHMHGDHCLGLPGILQRLSLDGTTGPVALVYPASGQQFIQRLRFSSAFEHSVEVELFPVQSDGMVMTSSRSGLQLLAQHLDHRVETIGFKLEESEGRRFLADRLAAFGISGPAVGQLDRDGSLTAPDGRLVRIDEVTVPRARHKVAFVMDTRVCDAAVKLAHEADLLICEATYLDEEISLARERGHLTARQAATIAREADARRLVLTHFSSRYQTLDGHLAEAAEVFPDVIAAKDLDRIAIPARDEIQKDLGVGYRSL